MNLSRPNSNDATLTFNRSKNVVPMSGVCSRCIDGCRGNCEVFRATFRGREVLYPGPFGQITAGADKDYPIDYSHLNIQGYALGAQGLPSGIEGGPDTAIFPIVHTETEYGWDSRVKMRLPVFNGDLGWTDIARNHWEPFALGAALGGITLGLLSATMLRRRLRCPRSSSSPGACRRLASRSCWWRPARSTRRSCPGSPPAPDAVRGPPRRWHGLPGRQ